MQALANMLPMVKLPAIEGATGQTDDGACQARLAARLAVSPLHKPSAPGTARQLKHKCKRKHEASRYDHIPISRSDLAEAAYQKGNYAGPVLYRGKVDLDVSLAVSDSGDLAAARWAANREASVAFRTRARRAGHQRQKKIEQYATQFLKAASPSPTQEHYATDLYAAEGHGYDKYSDQGSNFGASGTISLIQTRTPTHIERSNNNGQPELAEQPKCVLRVIKPKTCWATRMDNLGKSAKLSRTKKLANAWRKKVRDLREEDRESLQLVFSRGGQSARQLEMRLYDLGLQTTCDEEHEEIVKLCCEAEETRGVDKFHIFVGFLIPNAERMMRERYRKSLQEMFAKADKWSSGAINSSACLNAVVEEYVSLVSAGDLDVIKHDCERLFVETCDSERHRIGFDEFFEILWYIRKSQMSRCASRENLIIEAFGMNKEISGEARDDLLTFYQMLTKSQERKNASVEAIDEDGMLHFDAVDVKSLIAILTEYGVIPNKVNERKEMEELISDMFLLDEGSAKPMHLNDLRVLMQRLRALKMENHREELFELFKKYDKDNSGGLSHNEVSIVFGDLGLVPRSKADQAELKRMLDRVDTDESETIEFEEFEDLVQDVTEKLCSMQRRRENETAKRLELSPQKVMELRELFYGLDANASGGLEIQELRQILTMMRKTMSGPDLSELVSAVDKDRDGKVDFQEFLYFVKAIQHPTLDWRDFILEELGVSLQKTRFEQDGLASVAAASTPGRASTRASLFASFRQDS